MRILPLVKEPGRCCHSFTTATKQNEHCVVFQILQAALSLPSLGCWSSSLPDLLPNRKASAWMFCLFKLFLLSQLASRLSSAAPWCGELMFREPALPLIRALGPHSNQFKKKSNYHREHWHLEADRLHLEARGGCRSCRIMSVLSVAAAPQSQRCIIRDEVVSPWVYGCYGDTELWTLNLSLWGLKH